MTYRPERGTDFIKFKHLSVAKSINVLHAIPQGKNMRNKRKIAGQKENPTAVCNFNKIMC